MTEKLKDQKVLHFQVELLVPADADEFMVQRAIFQYFRAAGIPCTIVPALFETLNDEERAARH
jgi:hypothetical protein